MRSFLTHISVLLGLLWLMAAVGLAEPLELSIWQNERHFKIADGDVLPLNRGPFFLVMALTPGEQIHLAAGPTPIPGDLESFGEGRGMAGPYGGTLFLDWEAFHVFYYEPGDPYRRADLWDRKNGLAYFRLGELQQREPDLSLTRVPLAVAPDLSFVVRKQGCPEVRWQVHWATANLTGPRPTRL